MSERLVRLWVSGEGDLSALDWQAALPAGVCLEQAEVRSFPWADVAHTITWWITRPLTAEEFDELERAENEVLARIVGDGFFHGIAGPVSEDPS